MHQLNQEQPGFETMTLKMARFPHPYTISRNKLLHQYCRSMYGSQLWLLSSESVTNMCTQWRKSHRQALLLPYRIHCDLIHLIAENIPSEIYKKN